jgi:taurine dioxygenase
MLSVKPVCEALGAEVTGVQLGEPLPSEVQAELVRLFNAHGLLVFREQTMDKARLMQATTVFGAVEVPPLSNIHDADFPEVAVISTHGAKGDVTPDPEEIVGRIDWHTDQAYVVKPNRGGVMYGHDIPPEGGMTGFLDMAALYDALDEGFQAQLDGLSLIASWRHAQETIRANPAFRSDEGSKMLDPDLFPDMVFPLVQSHPVTGRKVLFVPPLWSAGIVEMDADAGRALVDRLLAHARKPEFAYWHSYRPGDVVVWDNWRMMHAASGTLGRYRRTLHRTVINGGLELGVPLKELLARRASAAPGGALVS